MTLGRFYIMVVKVTLIFGLETWVLNPRMARTLGGFHHQVVQLSRRNLLKRYMDGVYKYSPNSRGDKVVKDQGFGGIHQTESEHISTRPIMDLCMESKRRLGARVEKRWW